jgi:riboflavin kinase/FMN adenylyltransferase
MGQDASPNQKRPPAVVTIGVFDGIHLGHQLLVERVRTDAGRNGALGVVITFSRHPLAVLDPRRCPLSLTTIRERTGLLESMGLDRVHVIDFTSEIANTSARSFVEQMILSRYRLIELVVGPDFAMGRDRHGDRGMLTRLGSELGFQLEQVPAVPLMGAPVSSSRIRTVLGDGEVALAARLLGRPYEVRGVVVTGEGRGHGLGFPTANVEVAPEKLLPKHGVYAVRCQGGGIGAGHPAVANIGTAPTFGGTVRRLEVHVLDWSGQLVGHELEVAFEEHLRDERQFPSAASLKAQIEADADRAKVVLDSGARSS